MPMHKLMPKVLIVSMLLMCLFGPLNAWAMRCGNYLINKGDSQKKVAEQCGEPTSKTSRHIIRPGTYPSEGSGLSINDERAAGNDRHYAFDRSEVLMEEWTYNLGPDKLMRRIQFANGIVEDVKTLDYGHHED